MPGADPPLSVAQRMGAACDLFKREWRAGRRPSIDDLVAAAPEPDRDALRSALLAVEAELKSRGAGETSVSKESVRTGDYTGPGPTVARPPGQAVVSNRIGRFEIRAVLGSGAFGCVYRAFDPELDREVALKVPLPDTLRTPADRERFVREAKAAASIDHPNVCRIHEVGEHAGQPYIVMAIVPGQSLAEVLRGRKEPLPEKQAAIIVRKLALALHAAHKKGVVHRDLKPANVMFDKERKDLVVMDFGLARRTAAGDARDTQSGAVMGTPAYMSPEQARGASKDVGPEGDIFSLGVIMYELLAGSRPFQGTAHEVIGQILLLDPEPPSARRAGVNSGLEAVCLKALAKDPRQRFASMKEFAAAVDACLRKPASSAAETAKAAATTPEGKADSTADADSSTDRRNLADMIAEMSVQRKRVKAETAEAVERAAAKHRVPRSWIIALGVLLLVGFAATAAIVFFSKNKKGDVKVAVQIELPGVDLSDKTLSYFLDEEPITAEQLSKEMELTPGEHWVVVKRGKEVLKRVKLTVSGGEEPGIKVQDHTPKEPPPSPPVDEPDFVPLFNGTDLTGWDVIRGLQPPQTPLNAPEGWAVEGGTLLCTSAEFLWLRSAKAYRNFVLKLDVKLPAGGANSGVYLRNPGTKTGLDGFHVQIVPEDTKWPPTWRAGGLWNAVAPKVAAIRPAGDWNQLEIECEGSKVMVKLNGKVTVDLDLNDHKDLKDRPRSGFIGLANFQGEARGVAYRNIRIKELPQPAEARFVPLFNGKDLTGWKADSGPPGQWKVEDGAIVGRSAGFNSLGHLLTTADYSDFVLRLEYWVERNGHGGIVFRASPGERWGTPPPGIPAHPTIKLMDPNFKKKDPTGATHWVTSGKAYDSTPTSSFLLASETWHSVEIVVKGDTLTATFDGKHKVEQKLSPGPMGQGDLVPGLKRTRGKIGFQAHTKSVKFRNIEVKELVGGEP